MEVWEIVGIEQNAKFKGDNGELVAGIRLHSRWQKAEYAAFWK